MRKKITLESYEKDYILSLHNREKFLSEQQTNKVMTGKEAKEFFNNAKAAGCLRDPQLNFDDLYSATKDDGQKVIYIKSEQSSGKVKRVFTDFTFDVTSNDGTREEGVWDCDEITNVKLKKYLDQGYQKIEDLFFKSQSKNPEFYQPVAVDGITLYKPVYDYYSQVGVQENYPLGSPQRDFLHKLETAGYVVNPAREDRTFMDLQPSTDVKVDANLFPKGLEVYTNLQKTKNINLSGASGSYKNLKYEPKTCEEAVELYWNRYKDHLPGSGPEFEQLKSQVQNCLYQNMYRWEKIGGVLGIGGGANHLDKILELFTNVIPRYKGVTQPGPGRPYTLKPSRQQKR